MQKKWNYRYDFPAQRRKYKDTLNPEDKWLIARKMGLSYNYINNIVRGERRMPDQMRQLADGSIWIDNS